MDVVFKNPVSLAGKDLVERLLRQECADAAVEWDDNSDVEDDFESRRISLAWTCPSIDGEWRIEKFRWRELADAPGNATVSTRLQRRIADFVNKARLQPVGNA
ncbi:MAG TPA: hypothetical protein VJH03_02830 [Blastocatellia bacterium]|nr:hypothetical protein [Blastocatellia bacterium]